MLHWQLLYTAITRIECSPAKKNLASQAGASRQELAMCLHSPESQQYAGLHQKTCGQQVKGGEKWEQDL